MFDCDARFGSLNPSSQSEPLGRLFTSLIRDPLQIMGTNSAPETEHGGECPQEYHQLAPNFSTSLE